MEIGRDVLGTGKSHLHGFPETSIVFIHGSMPFWQKENPDLRVGAFHGFGTAPCL
jgi:hypothetical protein